jgi:hypothetical protein
MTILVQFILPALILLALVALFAFIEVHADDNVIRTAPLKFNRDIFHRFGFLRRAFVVITGILLSFGLTLTALASLVLATAAFWVVFEAGLSHRIWGTFYKVGTTAKTDLQIRRLANRLGESPEHTKMLLMVWVLYLALIVYAYLIALGI